MTKEEIMKFLNHMLDEAEAYNNYLCKKLPRFGRMFSFYIPEEYETKFGRDGLMITYDINKFIKWLKMIDKTDDEILEFLTHDCGWLGAIYSSPSPKELKNAIYRQGEVTVIFEEAVVSKKGKK